MTTRSRKHTPPIPASVQRRLISAFKPIALLAKAKNLLVLQPSAMAVNSPNSSSDLTLASASIRPGNPHATPPKARRQPSRSTSPSLAPLSSIRAQALCEIYGLEPLADRLRRMGFLELDALRRANPYHLRRPGGFNSPRTPPRSSPPSMHPLTRVTSPTPRQDGLTEVEVTELFLALRMFDEELGPNGEDLRAFLLNRGERGDVQRYRKTARKNSAQL